jgi:hypothetical protein
MEPISTTARTLPITTRLAPPHSCARPFMARTRGSPRWPPWAAFTAPLYLGNQLTPRRAAGTGNNQITTASGASGLVTQAVAVTIGSLKFSGATSLPRATMVTWTTTRPASRRHHCHGRGGDDHRPRRPQQRAARAISSSTCLSPRIRWRSPRPLTSGTSGGLTVTGAGTVFLSNPSYLLANSAFTGNIYIDGGLSGGSSGAFSGATLSIIGTGISDPTTLGSAVGQDDLPQWRHVPAHGHERDVHARQEHSRSTGGRHAGCGQQRPHESPSWQPDGRKLSDGRRATSRSAATPPAPASCS